MWGIVIYELLFYYFSKIQRKTTLTHIILILKPKPLLLETQEDPRTPREISSAVNLGHLHVRGALQTKGGFCQRAVIVPSAHTVVVEYEPPHVRLTPRQYQVLFGLCDGKRARTISAELGISCRMVYQYSSELKARFHQPTTYLVLVKAYTYGMIDKVPVPRRKKTLRLRRRNSGWANSRE